MRYYLKVMIWKENKYDAEPSETKECGDYFCEEAAYKDAEELEKHLLNFGWAKVRVEVHAKT